MASFSPVWYPAVDQDLGLGITGTIVSASVVNTIVQRINDDDVRIQGNSDDGTYLVLLYNSLSTEMADARGAYTMLGDRLNAIEAQLP